MGGLFLILLLYRLSTAAALQMTGPSTYTASVGSIAHIPCTFTAHTLPADPRNFAVIWYFDEKNIISFDNTIKSINPRYSLDEDRALNGNADLTISNVSVSDAGEYECSVTDSPSRMETFIRVTIIATPNITILNKVVTKSIKSNLQGIIFGFYPVDIEIKWLRDGQRLDNVITEKPQRNPDGTYSVNSSVIITPTEEDRERIFSCRVRHESLRAPLREDFQLLYSDKPQLTIPTKIAQRDTENTLTCMVTGFFPSDIDVTWYKDGEVLNNQLMGEPHRNDNGTYQVISTVTITPSNDDENRIFSCRVQHISLQEPLQEDFPLLLLQDTSLSSSLLVPIVIPLVIVILALIVGPILWKKCRKRKRNQNNSQQNYKVVPAIEGSQDLPRPHVKEILICNLKKGEKASLICYISNYCPEYLKVSWFRKEPGEKSIITPLPNKHFQTINEQRKDEKSWRARLTFTASFSRDEGAEFICRVNYASLEPPIERTTGPIRFELCQYNLFNTPKNSAWVVV